MPPPENAGISGKSGNTGKAGNAGNTGKAGSSGISGKSGSSGKKIHTACKCAFFCLPLRGE
ncbi:MAG: hypothetical protein IJS05_07130 [Paludibacteraceae bacterium]|nr:hypothetical protein [Paludibacteraceae bacterium]